MALNEHQCARSQASKAAHCKLRRICVLTPHDRLVSLALLCQDVRKIQSTKKTFILFCAPLYE